MLLDKFNTFADGTSVGTPNSTVVNVGEVIDLGVARNLGESPLWLVIQVTTAITSGGAATVSFALSSDAQAAIAVDGTETRHIETDVIAKATLVAGYQMAIPLPKENPVYERYLGFQVRENGGNVLTAGNVNAFLTTDPQSWKAYAAATGE